MSTGDMKNVPGQCPLCKAAISEPAVIGGAVYGGSAAQRFYRCALCDVAFLYPAMGSEEEKRFYSQEFEKFMEKRAGADFDWSGPEAHLLSSRKQYVRRLRFFRELLKPGKRVLEIGCSSGFMLLPLREMGLEVVGVEPSGSFTAFLENRGIDVYPSLEILGAEGGARGRFDIVMHFFVLEHIRQPVDFLREALEYVAPGGSMVFEVPSRSDPLLTVYKVPAFDDFYWSAAHHYYFNRTSLEYVVRQVSGSYRIIPEQRYDLSNHFTWAMEGKPGGQGKYSAYFTEELDEEYRRSMMATGNCDTYAVVIQKEGRS